MPTTINQDVLAAQDGYANFNDVYNTANNLIYAGHLATTNYDNRAFLRFPLTTPIPRYSTVSAASLNIRLAGAPVNPIPTELRLVSQVNAALPGTKAAVFSLPLLTEKVLFTYDSTEPVGVKSYDVAAMINALAQLGDVSALVFVIRAQDPSYLGGRRNQYTSADAVGNYVPNISVTYEAATPVTADLTESFNAFQLTAEATVGDVSVVADLTKSFNPFTLLADATQELPQPITASVVQSFNPFTLQAHMGQVDPKRHTYQRVISTYLDSHKFVTEAGEVLGFSANFDDTLGVPPTGVLGLDDSTWYPEAGLQTAEAEALEFEAVLVGRNNVNLAREILRRKLPDVRQIVLPSGMVREVHYAGARRTPAPHKIAAFAIPTGRYSKHPILDYTEDQLFYTEGSTPEYPVVATDASHGITATLLPTWVTRASLAFAFKLGAVPSAPVGLASVGTPVEADGSFDPSSVALSLDREFINVSARGVLNRVRWSPFGSVLDPYAVALAWDEYRAFLVVATQTQAQLMRLNIGSDVALSEQVVTLARNAEGVGTPGFFGLGSVPLGLPTFNLEPFGESAALRASKNYLTELAAPGRSWEVRPPDMSLAVSRASTGGLELAPGETIQVDVLVERVGEYLGNLEAAVYETADTPTLTLGTPTVINTTGAIHTYRFSVTAPEGTPDGLYALRFQVQDETADDEGSFYTDVRGTLDLVPEVVATPEIMPNPTLVLLANDPEWRPEVVLADTSAYGNSLTYHGLARPGRAGTSLLVPAKGVSGIVSGTLNNAAQAQRMNANHTLSLVLAELSKTSTANGVVATLFHATQNTGTVRDGVWIIRVVGGLKLRTYIGGAMVESVDVLPWSSGFLEVSMRVGTTLVTLTDRSTMRSITLFRPAWADASVRASLGCSLTPGGAVANTTRVHVKSASLHPYELTDAQLKRNLLKLAEYAPASDGFPEYPDGFFVIAEFNENTVLQPSEKWKNRAAPAMGVLLKRRGSGTVGTFDGGITTPGTGQTILTTGFIPNTSAASENEAVFHLVDMAAQDPYDAQATMSASSQYNGYTRVLTKYGGVPTVNSMQNNGDFSLTKDFPKAPKVGDSIWCLAQGASGKTQTVRELVGGNTQTLTRDQTLTGTVAVTIGGALRNDNSVGFQHKAKARWMGLHLGHMSAQDRADLQQLLLR